MKRYFYNTEIVKERILKGMDPLWRSCLDEQDHIDQGFFMKIWMPIEINFDFPPNPVKCIKIEENSTYKIIWSVNKLHAGVVYNADSMEFEWCFVFGEEIYEKKKISSLGEDFFSKLEIISREFVINQCRAHVCWSKNFEFAIRKINTSPSYVIANTTDGSFSLIYDNQLKICEISFAKEKELILRKRSKTDLTFFTESEVSFLIDQNHEFPDEYAKHINKFVKKDYLYTQDSVN